MLSTFSLSFFFLLSHSIFHTLLFTLISHVRSLSTFSIYHFSTSFAYFLFYFSIQFLTLFSLFTFFFNFLTPLSHYILLPLLSLFFTTHISLFTFSLHFLMHFLLDYLTPLSHSIFFQFSHCLSHSIFPHFRQWFLSYFLALFSHSTSFFCTFSPH